MQENREDVLPEADQLVVGVVEEGQHPNVGRVVDVQGVAEAEVVDEVKDDVGDELVGVE